MPKYQRFDEIPVWQEAARLYQHVLDTVEEPNVPLSATFRNQLERATLAISSGVAEAFDAKTPDLAQMLAGARDAALEVQSMVSVIAERPKLARLREPLQRIRGSAESCARQLGSWKWAVENGGARKGGGGQEGPQEGAAHTGRSSNWSPKAAANNRGEGQGSTGGR